MLTDEKTVSVARANLAKHMDSAPPALAPVWKGILDEFRNHLASIAAATTAVRAVTPTAAVPEISQALLDAECNTQRLTALVAFVEAAVRGGALATVDLDKVIEGALRLAAPALGRVAVSFDKPHRIDVRNRGTALESLIAGLIVDLAHAGARTAHPSYCQQIDVHADVGRGATVLWIDSSGQRPSPGSWRLAMARDLASQIGATVTVPDALAGFAVRLDSSS